MIMNDPVTVIFFSCRRLALLDRVIRAFVGLNTYPNVGTHIIVNDSGDPKIHDELRRKYEDFTLVLNKENIGLIKSVDIGYSYITTDYFFHLEDDWLITKEGFIERSLDIMNERADIEEVWLRDYNEHPLEPIILHANNTPYKIVTENYQKGMNGYNDFAWHGFTTALGLKRISDYNKVKSYADIPCLLDNYATNIGYGQSEYITGFEK